MTYSSNPSDGETVTIDRVTYEFDSNASVGAGRVMVGITDTAEGTFVKLRDLVNGGGVASVYATLLPDTRVMYFEAREAGFAGNAIAFGKSGASLSVDGSTLGNAGAGSGQVVDVNKVINLVLSVSGGTVSRDKSAWSDIVSYTMVPGETEGMIWFRAGASSGGVVGNVSVSYSENGVDWINGTQLVSITEPFVKITSSPQMMTAGSSGGVIEVQLKDVSGLTSYQSFGTNSVRLVSSSSGGLFGLSSSGSFGSGLVISYAS